MAAGLSIEPQRIPEFRRALSRTVGKILEGIEDLSALSIAGYMPLSGLSLDLAAQMERLAPFGSGNPAPTLATVGVELVGSSSMGRKGEHLLMTLRDEQGGEAKVIWWQGNRESLPEGRFDLAYTVRATNFRGQRDVQIEWIDARVVEPIAIRAVRERPPIEAVDYRDRRSPAKLLGEIRAEAPVEVWSEAGHRSELGGTDRRALAEARFLVIWTAPPGPRELRNALKRASPERVYLFGIDPGMDDPQRFLERLAGLIKRALSASQGWASLEMLSAATAQRISVVRAGVDWLIEHGDIDILDEEGDDIRLGPGSGRQGSDVSGAAARLRALLDETSAYRAHFLRTPTDTLLAY
jgi:single-stranded-DNA-specific exonuclease